jgi:NAD(P)-dependent dehydrogenase (short-subunit alcohol dehydrogenase family)
MPGLIKTEMTERFAQLSLNDVQEDQKKKQLLGIGMPSDIANFVVFLLSDMSSFCTGRSYYADGGRI